MAPKEKYTKLNLPAADLQTREVGVCRQVWDALRGRWLVLTPEEWVRRHFIAMLTDSYGIDAHRIAQEYPMQGGGTAMRADIVVFSKEKMPVLVVECKAPSVKLTQEAVDQAGRYNAVLGVEYVAVTNGLTHYLWHIDREAGTFRSVLSLPEGL